MGRVMAKVRLANAIDLALAQQGVIKPEEVRRREVDALADSGASLMCLPEDIVAELGLEPFSSQTAMLATGEHRELAVVGTARIEIGDRIVNQDCVVLPRGAQPLIGQLVLQEMDLVIDLAGERLAPGHPDEKLPVMDLL